MIESLRMTEKNIINPAVIAKNNKGLWSEEAETYLLENWKINN
ncbi:MAG: hypothetical protein ACREVX_05855 [Clostridium sp.]